jgi:hypothetical protein
MTKRVETCENEARWRNQRSVRSGLRIVGIRPQRIVIANALAEAEDREPGSVLVVYAGIGAQLEANSRAHVVEHLVGELAASKLARDVDRRCVSRLRQSLESLINWFNALIHC